MQEGKQKREASKKQFWLLLNVMMQFKRYQQPLIFCDFDQREQFIFFLFRLLLNHLKSCQTRTWMKLLTFGIESLGELLYKTGTDEVPLNF